MRYLIPLLFVILGIQACGLEREIDLELPEYDPEIVVEGYLEPGQPYFITLVESVGYLGTPSIQFVRDAEVTITYQGQVDTLQFVELDTLSFYLSTTRAPADYDTDFFLKVNTREGKEVTATTRIKPPVAIDSLAYRFNDDSLAFVLTYLTDDPIQKNYYRRILWKRVLNYDTLSVAPLEVDSTWQSWVQQAFSFDDRAVANNQIALGTAFDYEKGDTLISQIYHITEDYFNYLESVDAAVQANLNPFGQPSTIITNIKGGLGIFTGFTKTEETVVIE